MVSSRSKTAAEAAANKRTTRSAAASSGQIVSALTSPEQDLKPVSKKAVQATSKRSASKPASSKESISTTSSTVKAVSKGKKKSGPYCICKGDDDGSPMIKCEGACKNWYHFECMGLDEDVAGEIESYYCPECEATSGLKTVSKLDFEGLDAFVDPAPPSPQVTEGANKKLETPLPEAEVVESAGESDDAGSDDNYIAEPTGKRANVNKRTAHRLSLSSDKSESDEDDPNGGRRRRASRGGRLRLKRLKKGSASPVPESSSALKRRGSSAQQPAAKRSKTSDSAQDDPIRRYCLTKLEEIVRPMFLEHQDVKTENQTEPQAKAEGGSDAKEEITLSMTEEEVDATDQKIRTFVNELERCMMEIYAELDKSGRPSAGGKYKERFRMLQFNLPKPDRVILRKGIATGRITPAQLNVMSSTDLADEQTKHDIELAEKESLQHSILQKITAPSAKMTHKGYEAIEDFSGQRTADAAKEEEENRARMEKLEREKLSRLRTVSVSQQDGSGVTPVEQSPLSAGFPKTGSPTVSNIPHTQQSWGAPPPIPSHAAQAQGSAAPGPSPTSSRPAVRPLFVPSISNEYTSDQGLSLADLIDIDGDMSTQEAPQSTPQQRMSAQVNAEAGSSSSPVITTPSGPSPFAPSKPAESPIQSSFDLNSFWSNGVSPGNEALNEAVEKMGDNVSTSGDTKDNHDDDMEVESAEEEDEERALDAILQQSANTNEKGRTEPSPAAKTIDTLPEVWSGQINMPRENFDQLLVDVACKQIGGRTLEPMSGFWQTLFPSPQARIDGRVPVAHSIKYLVSIRLNSTKELIIVNFAPRTAEARAKFNELTDFLVGKDRHALVFPWGTQPKPQAPGRELYIIPLLKDQPIPEFIELMDDHRLPKERSENSLLGVFVLNKGKLVASTPPLPPTAVASSFGFATTSIPGLSSQGAYTQSTLPGIPTAPRPSIIPVSQSPIPPTPPIKVDQAALEAEVASLTPEQLSLMLRHLSQSASLAASVNHILPSTAPPPVAVPPVYGVPSIPPFPPQFSPPYQQNTPPPPHHYSPPHIQGQGSYGDYQYDDRDDQPWDYGHDGRGGRGERSRGGERGRRGSRGRGGKAFYDDRAPRLPPADRGWSNRGRGGVPR